MKDNGYLKVIGDLTNDMGKAVQLYVKQTPVLAIGDIYSFYHGDVLDNVLNEMEIPHEKTVLKDGRYHAKNEGGLYVAVGMGDADLYEKDKGRIYLSGNSLGYGLNIDEEHAKILNSYLNGIEVKID